MSVGELRDVKRPACLQRQTGACRRCGPAACQPCRGREEPVGAQDLSATDRRTPTDQVRTRRRARSVPESSGRGDQPQPADWFPTEGAINPDRQADVQRRKRSTPTAGLDRGRRTSVNSVVSARAASCGELGQVRFGSIPSWATGESESSSGHACATGIAHPGFYGRKPWSKA